ncbi:hypothetical protein N7522_010610 [Penicillium canescens]|nr:hypothetical protein N7522_010610 [Penicillium canescens]
MSEFDQLAMVSAFENEFADMLQVYKQMPDCNLSIVDILQGQLDVDSASSTPTCLPSTPVFGGTDPSLRTQSKSSSTINGNENDFMDFHWDENDGCPYLWNPINEVSSSTLAGMERTGDSWHLPNENSKESQPTPMAPMHTFQSTQAQSTASPVSQDSVEPKHHSNPQGLTASPRPTAPFAHSSTTKEVAPRSSISTGNPPFDLAPSPSQPSIASPCPASPIPKAAIARKNSTAAWKRRNWHPTATLDLRPKVSPVVPFLNQQNATSPDLSTHNLDTKSNYQHIQDGTLPPGVKYPIQVTKDNLNQKRTYHRLAERNRRDRFNTAIREMEALIPAEFVEERNKASGLALTAISNSNSTKEKEKAPSVEQTKADVMEIAADYIKMLCATLDEKIERINRLGVAGSDVSV